MSSASPGRGAKKRRRAPARGCGTFGYCWSCTRRRRRTLSLALDCTNSAVTALGTCGMLSASGEVAARVTNLQQVRGVPCRSSHGGNHRIFELRSELECSMSGLMNPDESNVHQLTSNFDDDLRSRSSRLDGAGVRFASVVAEAAPGGGYGDGPYNLWMLMLGDGTVDGGHPVCRAGSFDDHPMWLWEWEEITYALLEPIGSRVWLLMGRGSPTTLYSSRRRCSDPLTCSLDGQQSRRDGVGQLEDADSTVPRWKWW